MSYFGKLFTRQPISLIDGMTSEFSINELYNELELAFDSVGNVFGNLYGTGSDSSLEPKWHNSVAFSMGDMSKVSPEKPFGTIFNGYTQQFINDGSTKDFILDLIPVTVSSISISSFDQGIIWTPVQDPDELSERGRFIVRGRVLTFFTSPTGSFTVSYTGKHPELQGMHSGFSPNVYPSPVLIESGEAQRPSLSLQDGKIRVDIAYTNKNRFKETNPALLAVQLNPAFQKYISASQIERCPQEMISAWIKTPSGYRKVLSDSIYILSESSFLIETPEEIDINNDTIVMCLANVSLAEMVQSLYLAFSKHSHNFDEIVSPIGHANLAGLLPNSSNPLITYGLSNILNNDHPQYFHREGFNPNDPGSYNNAILGDVFIASKDEASLFNNINADSNKLIFGSTTNGVSLKYIASGKYLGFYSGHNGLSITTDTSGSDNFSLNLDGHKLYSRNNGTLDNDLYIAPSSGLVKVVKSNGDLASIEAGNATVSQLNVNKRIAFHNEADLHIGNVKISSIESLNNPDQVSLFFSGLSSTSLIEIAVNSLLHNAEIKTGLINKLDIKERVSFGQQTKLLFNNLSSYFAPNSTNTLLTYTSSKPLFLTETGINSGLAVGYGSEGSEQYMALYAADPSGNPSTPTTSNVYLEVHDRAFHIIKSIQHDQYDDLGNLKKWKSGLPGERVDYLDQWPHADLYAKEGSFKSVKVGISTLTERKGVSFGLLNNIYVTGGDNKCSAGWMVLESQNGVVFVESRSNVVDCESMSYSGLTCGSIQSYGNITVKNHLYVGEDVTATKALRSFNLYVEEKASVGSDLYVGGELDLRGKLKAKDVEVNGSLSVSDTIDTRILKSVNSMFTGISNFKEVATFDKTVQFKSDAAFDVDVSIKGIVTVTTLQVSGDALCVGTLSASELKSARQLTANGGILCNGSIDVTGSISATSLDVQEGVLLRNTLRVYDTATFSKNIIVNDDSTFNASLNVKGIVGLAGSLTVGGSVVMNSNLRVADSASFLNDVNVSGAFKARSLSSSTSIEAVTSISVGESNDNSTTINGNNVNINGSTAKLTVVNASINNISGDSSIEFKGETMNGLVQNHGQALVNGFNNVNYSKINNAFINGRALFKGDAIFEDTLYVKAIKSINTKGLTNGVAQDGNHWIDVAARVAYYA